MQNKLLITVLTITLIIILTLTLHISFVNASIVTFNMDTLPENERWTINKTGNVTSVVSNGILTIENNGGKLDYYFPADWNNTLNVTKGWIVEFRLKLENSNISSQNSLRYISIYDKQFIPTIELSENGIDIFIPIGQSRQYLMNTTDNFHVYKLIGQGSELRVFVDEKLVFNVPRAIGFYASGPIHIESDLAYTKSHWDYISYDTTPNVTFTFPTLTVIDGTSSYYISSLTDVTVDNSPIVIPNGTYAGWCVDKSTVMPRNEGHNIILYSSTQVPVYDLTRYNWSSVNYILNHKQGSMQDVQNAIWYFAPDQTSAIPPLNETVTWSMINEAKANPNYIPGKGDIMAILAYADHPIRSSPAYATGVQNTIIEYKIP